MMLAFMVVGIISLIILILIKMPINWINRLHGSVSHPDTRKTLITIFTSIATIFSIFFAIGIYFEDKAIQEDNDRIVLENMRDEIEQNLVFVNGLGNNSEEHTSIKVPAWRYRYSFLNQALGILKDGKSRRIISVTINNMQMSNLIMNGLGDDLLEDRERNVGVLLEMSLDINKSLVWLDKQMDERGIIKFENVLTCP